MVIREFQYFYSLCFYFKFCVETETINDIQNQNFHHTQPESFQKSFFVGDQDNITCILNFDYKLYLQTIKMNFCVYKKIEK